MNSGNASVSSCSIQSGRTEKAIDDSEGRLNGERKTREDDSFSEGRIIINDLRERGALTAAPKLWNTRLWSTKDQPMKLPRNYDSTYLRNIFWPQLRNVWLRIFLFFSADWIFSIVFVTIINCNTRAQSLKHSWNVNPARVGNINLNFFNMFPGKWD